jgi:hypothetical protein
MALRNLIALDGFHNRGDEITNQSRASAGIRPKVLRAPIAGALAMTLVLFLSSCQKTRVAVGSSSTASPSSTSPSPVAVSPSASPQAPIPAPTMTANEPSAGEYFDGPIGAPHYALTVATHPGGFGGWMFFVYQDGHTSEILHYNALTSSSGNFTLTSDTPPGALPFGSPPAFPQAGSSPIGPGKTFAGGFVGNSITLSNCGSYLYWAGPAGGSSPDSCTFTYSGPVSGS